MRNTTWSGTTLVLMRIERDENAGGRLKRVDAGLRHGGMRLLAGNRHLEVQAAVVRGDDGIGEPGGDRGSGPGQLLVEQPFRADDAANLLVVGEVELERSPQLVAAGGKSLERQQRPGVGGEVRFRHCDATPIHDGSVRTVLDHRAIGVEAPSQAGRHDVAVGVERDDRPLAEPVAHDQVGHALHSCRFHRRSRHLVRLDGQAELLQQFARALGMRPAIARWIIARDLHQLGKESALARKLAIDEITDGFGRRHDACANRRTVSRTTRAATSASSAVMISSGE